MVLVLGGTAWLGSHVARAALARALEEAGLPEQPEKWVSDAGAEIAAGRRIIVDRTIRDEDDPRRGT
jgi:uncharacterized protein YbjT (DUF2867 family)